MLVRRSVTVLVALAVAIAGMTLLRPADAATRRMPGAMTGYAFDTCQAPSQAAMDVWWENSPYWGVGIYTSGRNRFCDVQVELSPAWVATQNSRGWRLFPIHVGLQASCSNPQRAAARGQLTPQRRRCFFCDPFFGRWLALECVPWAW